MKNNRLEEYRKMYDQYKKGKWALYGIMMGVFMAGVRVLLDYLINDISVVFDLKLIIASLIICSVGVVIYGIFFIWIDYQKFKLEEIEKQN